MLYKSHMGNVFQNCGLNKFLHQRDILQNEAGRSKVLKGYLALWMSVHNSCISILIVFLLGLAAYKD